MVYCFLMLMSLVLFAFKKIQMETVLIIYAAFIPVVLGKIVYHVQNIDDYLENLDNDNEK